MKKKYFIPFLIGNYPKNSKFIKILNFISKNGIKTIEIGIPFSESYLDGKIISDIYKKIKNFSLDDLLKSLKKFENIYKILVCYSNFIESIGMDFFLKKIKRKINSLLIVDQPLKYLLKMKKKFIRNNIKFVYIICTNNIKIINNTKNIFKELEKYNLCSHIYLINRLGVTGEKIKINYKNIYKNFIKISKLTRIPIITGFGINKNNFSFYKEKKINFVIGTKIIKYIKERKIKKLKKFIKKCIK
ncbi:Tryptophan synthase alpha chain [Candidatus Vidania fulgoroideae]|uniref:tryptophan synthase n=1 Tax=Candidatus Vidania fulgoroideorum TaxID=881286 RepID=A0A346E0G5_9PROT|nr:Tryptophan synthase alpha chain [Candidatus Vidania fulgoroideae]